MTDRAADAPRDGHHIHHRKGGEEAVQGYAGGAAHPPQPLPQHFVVEVQGKGARHPVGEIVLYITFFIMSFTVLIMAEFSLVSFLRTILEYIFAMANKQMLRFILVHCNVSLKNYKHHQLILLIDHD